MFILFGTHYIDPAAGAASDGVARAQAVTGLDANGRSTWSEPAVPSIMGCSADQQMAYGMSADATAQADD